jgi:hypothetical protein
MTGVWLLAAVLGAAGAAGDASAAGDADADAPPAPPHARVTITAERPQLILGVEQEMTLAIEVQDNDGALRFVPERAVASIGTIAAVTAVGPDRFAARYLAPNGRFPQVAIIVVDLAGGGQHLRAITRLALHAAAEMPFHTSANAWVTVRVEDRSFGPVRADGQGNVTIPIVVPPGVRQGRARATDAYGSTRETLVDLQPASFNQLLIMAAPQFEAGNFAEVSIFAVTARGDPMTKGRATLRSAEGMVHPLGSGVSGEERFLVEAPVRLEAGPVHLVATAVDVATDPIVMVETRTERVVPLIAGRASRLLLTPSTDHLTIGGPAPATVVVAARDRHDNPTSCAGASVTVEHRKVAMASNGAGGMGGCGTVHVPAPREKIAKGSVEIEATLGTLRARTTLRVINGPAVRLTAVLSTRQVVGDGRQSIDVRVDGLDRIGLSVPVSNLRWQTAGGRIGPVQTPQEGTYVTQFTPNHTYASRTEVLVVNGDPALSATAMVNVEPPRPRIAVAARVGLFSNFGSMTGTLVSIEGLRELPGRAAAWAAGIAVTYLRNDLTTTGGGTIGLTDTRIQIDQVPVLAVTRYKLPLPLGLGANLGVGGGVGVSLARATLSSRSGSWPTSHGSATPIAAEGRADVAFPMASGEVIVGTRYLWVDLGRTSQDDEIEGNSVGLIGDIGFRMTW